MQALFTVVLIGFFLMDFNPLDLVVVILVLNTIRALFGAFHTSAVDTLLPIMVPKKHYSRINGINYFVTGLIFSAGPIVGAYALELMNLQTLLWLDVFTFLIAVIPTILIYIPVVRKVTTTKEKPSFISEFKTGMKFIRDTPGLFALLFVFAGVNFFLPPFMVQLPLFVTAIHLGDKTHLGFVMSCQQIGMLIGSTIMSTWRGFGNHTRGVALGIFLGYIGLATMLIAPIGFFLIIGLGMFIAGFTLPVANVSSEAIWASTVPRELLGRVYAVRRTLAQITAPIAMLFSGVLAELFGLYPVLLVSVILGLLTLGYSWFLTALPKAGQETKKEEKAQNELIITS